MYIFYCDGPMSPKAQLLTHVIKLFNIIFLFILRYWQLVRDFLGEKLPKNIYLNYGPFNCKPMGKNVKHCLKLIMETNSIVKFHTSFQNMSPWQWWHCANDMLNISLMPPHVAILPICTKRFLSFYTLWLKP